MSPSALFFAPLLCACVAATCSISRFSYHLCYCSSPSGVFFFVSFSLFKASHEYIYGWLLSFGFLLYFLLFCHCSFCYCRHLFVVCVYCFLLSISLFLPISLDLTIIPCWIKRATTVFNSRQCFCIWLVLCAQLPTDITEYGFRFAVVVEKSFFFIVCVLQVNSSVFVVVSSWIWICSMNLWWNKYAYIPRVWLNIDNKWLDRRGSKTTFTYSVNIWSAFIRLN